MGERRRCRATPPRGELVFDLEAYEPGVRIVAKRIDAAAELPFVGGMLTAIRRLHSSWNRHRALERLRLVCCQDERWRDLELLLVGRRLDRNM